MGQSTTTAAQATGNQLLSSEDLKDTPVYGLNGEQIGTIDHLMIDRESGQVIFAVVTFGGLLGMGESHYPVPWRSLKYSYELEGYTSSIDEDTVRDAPEFSDDSYDDPGFEDRVYKHYGAAPYNRSL